MENSLIAIISSMKDIMTISGQLADIVQDQGHKIFSLLVVCSLLIGLFFVLFLYIVKLEKRIAILENRSV